MLPLIEKDFPKLVETGYVKTSDETPAYNCIAFTLGDQSRPWWPRIHAELQCLDSYWPPQAPNQATVEAFTEMCRQHGFESAGMPDVEAGFLKIAIFVEPKEGLVEHAALQLPNGKWFSKMGLQEDIAHTLEGLGGPPHFFQVAAVLKGAIEKVPPGLRDLIARYS